MNEGDRRMAAELARAAAKEAIDAVLRKAQLGFDDRMRMGILALAFGIIESKARSMRALGVLGGAHDELVAKLTTTEITRGSELASQILARQGR